MNDDQKEFEAFAVELLFKRISEGRVVLNAERVPHLKKAIESVQFNDGKPIMDTVEPMVRSVALRIANEEVNQLEAALKKTGDYMGIEELLPSETNVADEVLAKCQSEGDFTSLAFELFKEAACLTSIVACSYKTELPTKFPWERNQAICAGLLTRTVKFMLAVGRLYASENTAEVSLALCRSILESATNVRFLLLKNSPSLFDEFVRCSLTPERRLFDEIQKNVQARGGTILPIEQRMLDSIEHTRASSNARLEDAPTGFKNWGGDLFQKLEQLKIANRYTPHQRVMSHSVHGDWVDLALFHLSHEAGQFGPNPDFCPEEPGLFLPVNFIVLEAATDYLQHYYPNTTDSDVLQKRIRSLTERIKLVLLAHETFRCKDMPSSGSDETNPSK